MDPIPKDRFTEDSDPENEEGEDKRIPKEVRDAAKLKELKKNGGKKPEKEAPESADG